MIKYLVIALHSWGNVTTNIAPLEGVAPAFGQGFMVVFDDEQEALKHYPDAQVHPIRFTIIPKETDNE